MITSIDEVKLRKLFIFILILIAFNKKDELYNSTE